MAENKGKEQPSLDLQIEVSNFGPISKTKDPVRVKPLTIFMGKSNTGKSYLAILLYALIKTYSQIDDYRRIDKIEGLIEELIKDKFKKLTQKSQIDIFEDDDKFFEILKECLNMRQVQPLIREIYQYDLRQWTDEIHRCIAPLTQLIRNSKSSSSNCLEIILKHNTLPFAHLKHIAKKSDYKIDPQWLKSITKEVCQNIFTRSERSGVFRRSNFMRRSYFRRFKDNLKLKKDKTKYLDIIVRQIIRELSDFLIQRYGSPFRHILSSDVYYFPAARTGLIQGHKAIVSAAIQRAARVGLDEDIKVPTLSGGIADFLGKLIRIDPSSDSYENEIIRYRRRNNVVRPKKGLNEVVNELETDVLKGQVDIKHSPVGYPDFIYKKDKLEIPMLRASSMVTELSPIVLYLKYYRGPKDTLIIEEPEAHLHPEAQKVIVKTLIALIKSGVNVILTTHSDTLLQEISNYRMSESVPEEKRKAIMGDNLCLSEDEVAVYNFKSDENGDIVVEHIPFDSEDGFSIEDHNEVSTQQYDQTIDIYDESRQHASKKSSK